jgi:hypothetical protein
MTNITPLARLLRKTRPEPATGCIVWTGYVCRSGYGKIWYTGKNPLAHRVAWELAHGPIPAGLHVCHRCDNRPCVNVDHLFLGTNADNMADRNAKGRARGGSMRGEAHPFAKLTNADVAAIRAARGVEKGRETASRFGVSPSRVSMIQTGKVWVHA